MKRFKKLVAFTLITAMMASSFSFSGIAAENKGERKLIEGEWYYEENGEILKNQLFQEGQKKYYAKEDGIIASDEFFQYKGKTWYAAPDGRRLLGWAYLSEEGHTLPTLSGGHWYYFANSDDMEGRIEDRDCRIGDYRYAFDEDGKMLSRAFGEEGTKYYEYDGEMASNKWLNIDDDWYRFKRDGSCYTASDNDEVASDSNASKGDYEFDEDGRLISDNVPFGTIDSIEVKGDADYNAEIGKEVKVTFDVSLASNSNATKAVLTENHDFWIEEVDSSDTYQRGWKERLVANKNEYTISYIPEFIEEFQVQLVIDGVKSDPVTITSDVGAEDTTIIKGIEHTLSGGASVTNRVESIKAAYGSLEDINHIKEVWINKSDNLRELDNSFAMINKNMISTDSAEAESLLGTGSLALIGGSLNAAPGEEIKLEATKGESVVLPESFERQTSIEFNLNVGGTDTSKLDIPVIVSLPIPKGMSSEGLKVFHVKEDGSLDVLYSNANDKEISFVTDGFSNFVFAGKVAGNSNNNNNSGGSGGGSGSGSSGGFVSAKKSNSANTVPETPGQWQQTETGWQFKKPDGSLYQNTWVHVKEKWYWIESTGIMAQGWKELNGKKYYLIPSKGEMVIGWILDGQNWFYTDATGAMQTGWVNVNKEWYYLDLDGHMLSATKTPDGYHVDENGAWVK